MQKNTIWTSWHMLTIIGGIVLFHGIAISALIPRADDPRTMTATILFSCALHTLLVSLVLRKWTAARIYFWIGGLRMIGALTAVTTRMPGSVDYRHLLVLVMFLVASLEFLAAIRLRRSDEPYRPLQLSAAIGLVAGAGLLMGYPDISDTKLSILMGFSMSMSGLAVMGLAFSARRIHRATCATIQQVVAPATGDVASA